MMKTSSTAINVNDRNQSKDMLFKFYLKNQSKSCKVIEKNDHCDIDNRDEKKDKRFKPSAMRRCFSKWRSFWKLKGFSDSLKQNTVESDFLDIVKRDPPKSLPLIRRSDHLNYGPLIHDSSVQEMSLSNCSKLSNDNRAESLGVSSFVPPPPLPLRQSITHVNNLDIHTIKRTTQALPNSYSRLTKSNHLIDNFRQLKQVPWYWGPLTKYDAELLLQNRENGVFLVRDSGHEAYVLSVSFRAGHRTYHTRVEHSSGKFSFWLNDRNAVKAANIVDFINQLIEESKNGHVRYLISDNHINDQMGDIHHSVDNVHVSVSLLTPFSRFQTVQSLAHLCRFQILLRIRRDHIGALSIPNFLKSYLQSPQYFVERIEDFL